MEKSKEEIKNKKEELWEKVGTDEMDYNKDGEIYEQVQDFGDGYLWRAKSKYISRKPYFDER